ncbi:hypothetical protein GLAREA_09838 [Glarea lozoyensis ATCC 20868]|uniref:Uncharacterized protein n=1 Tax=Glarea lozoyensis (strain ATCC 20868 / MF5171) TaxID=1116229 RepID=S3CQI3_GLAL2|nr:uncharacterized protein GLAREA_09838 [Glarea lozoyensis ATCC 20868]EPE28717.1 hypothetical protein GLAREA_09838 [Glarea lozoyensis ATCC 20868]
MALHPNSTIALIIVFAFIFCVGLGFLSYKALQNCAQTAYVLFHMADLKEEEGAATATAG